MTRRYTGGLLSATEQITDANTANGIFTMQEAGALTAAGNFPTGRWTPQRSLRFRRSASAYLSRTPSVASGQNQWTLSTWVKRGVLGDSASQIIGGNTTTSGGTRNMMSVEFGSDNALWVYGFTNASGYYFQRTSNQLFRDPSAWYHLVVQFDPDNATSDNKVIAFVNGQRLTWSTASDSGAAGNIGSSSYRAINNTFRNDINGGYQGGGVPVYFGDQYLSEMYMVSGSIVAPSDFAMTDPQTGTLIPKRYTGSYGTNGFYLPFNDNTTTATLGRNLANNYNLTPYSEAVNNWGTLTNITVTANSIANPLTGSSTADTVATNSVASGTYAMSTSSVNNEIRGVVTISGYFKSAASSTVSLSDGYGTGARVYFDLTTGTGSNSAIDNGTILKYGAENVGNGWYRCWITFSGHTSSAYPIGLRIEPGRQYGLGGTVGESVYAYGLMSNFGDVLSPYVATSTGSSTDTSWTTNNISVTAGVTYDSMVDVPGIPAVSSRQDVGGVVRGNYATWDPLSPPVQTTLSQANLLSSATGSSTNVITTFPTPTTGKWYAEITMNFTQNINWPIVMGVTNGIGGNTYLNLYTDWSARAINKSVNGVTSSVTPSGAFPANGDILKIAYDADAGKLWLGLNSTWYGASGSLTGSPETGGDPTLSGVAGREMYPNHNSAGGPAQNAYLNCGQRPFTYTPPTGFKSLNTTNFPNPVIKRPSEHFDIKTYNGNGGSQSIGVNPKQMASIPVNKSLRFRSNVSAYLTRTPTVAGNRTTWTWSGWIKRGSLGAAQWIFDGWQDGSNFTQISFTAGNAINIQNITSGTTNVLKTTTSLYSRTDAWYHIVFSVDTTQGTALNRFRIYVNGVQVTSFSTDTNTLAQNGLTFINSTNPHNIGRYATANYFDGYMADINFVDGQALTPGSFGTFDANNNWLPKTYTGTYGTNGFYLPMTSSGESYSADVLVVAGGGSGSGGGGGGGGVIPTTTTFAVGKTYTVSVGGGGTGGNRGTDSRIVGVSCEYTAIGGGGGYQSGGSGGGGWEPNSVGGSGTSGQGYKGGNAGGSVGDYGAGGGGGGGGAAGTNGSGTTPGTGGVGYQSAITGTNTYYAGGGGGGSPDNRYPRTTAGGLGGGGTSYYGSADAGTPNTGGGGGSAYPPLGIYGAGGSGVVILRIPTANYTGTVTGSPTVTTDGSFKVVKFTTSGSYTA